MKLIQVFSKTRFFSLFLLPQCIPEWYNALLDILKFKSWSLCRDCLGNLKFSVTRVTFTGEKRHKYISTNQNYKPLHESSSIGCLKAVMSLKVQRNKTTLSCSFRIGAIFTKNHTGVPERNIKRLVSNLPSHLRVYGSEDLEMNRYKYSFIF